MPRPAISLAAAQEDRAAVEAAAWARLVGATDSASRHAGWLAVLCAQVERVQGALLLLGPDAEGAFAPAAIWPSPSRDMKHLGPAAERALTERRGVILPAAAQPEALAFVACPIEISGTLHGAVVLALPPLPEAELQRALRRAHWATGWLAEGFRQRRLEEKDASLSRMAMLLQILASAMQEPPLAPSAAALVNEVAVRLGCARVSIGFEQDGRIQPHSISNTATFDRRMALVRLLGAAMDEVLDLDVPLSFPPAEGDPAGAMAQAELARAEGDAAVLSVPLVDGTETIGVLTLERSAGPPFDAGLREVAVTLGRLLGPIFALKRREARGAARRLRDTLRGGAAALFGPRYPGAKLVGAVLCGILALSVFVEGTYRVSAKTVIEGAVQRVAVAPFDGHLLQVSARAGDEVRQGQVMARLDDRDLRLELTRLTSEREQTLRRFRQALAVQDRSMMAVLTAQVAQAEAQIALAEQRLERAAITAPFDGVVVSGDLSNLLGAPIELGRVLFQVAPLDAYRVIVEVDERDIAQVALGQMGELTLSGLAGQWMRFTVRRITPVSTQQDGRNFFRVEAHLEDASPRVRPGMEGIGKITIDERRLIWIWTHSLVDWLRGFVWKWVP